MKSKYIKPSIRIKELDSAALMAGSTGQTSDGSSVNDHSSETPRDPGQVPSKENNNVWDNNDEQNWDW